MSLKINPVTGELDLVINPGGGNAATDFATDSGTANPTAAGEITISGGTGISTSGSSSTVTITLDTPVSVSNGGTGASTLTEGGIVLGSGTSAVTVTAQPTNGQILIGSTSSAPVLATLTAGTGISITNAAGSITINNTGTVSSTGSSTDNALVRWDGATGTLIQDSSIIVSDLDAVTGVTSLDVDNLNLDGNTFSSTDTNGNITISPDGSGYTLMTGSLVVDDGSATNVIAVNGANVTNNVSSHTAGATELGDFLAERHSDTVGFGSHILLSRSRGSEAIPAVVQNDDLIFQIVGMGFDGTDYAICSEILSYVDNVPGSDDMPGRIILATSPDGTQVPVEGFRLDSSQVVTLANALTVANGGTGATTLTDGGLLLGSGTSAITPLGQATNGQIPIGSSGADPVLATITAGAGISVTNGAGTISIANTAGGFAWTEVTGTSQAMAVENGYIANNAALVTCTLPATAALGEVMQIVGKGAGKFKIAQNAGQTIHMVASSTTTGAGGSLTAIEQYAALELICITANTDFVVADSSGNFTIV